MSERTGQAVAVTGAGGFLGSAIVERLKSQGHSVRALLRQSPVGVRPDESVSGDVAERSVAEAVVRGLAEESFLILPHPEVLEYMRRKTSDYDRWLRGMQRFRRNFV